MTTWGGLAPMGHRLRGAMAKKSDAQKTGATKKPKGATSPKPRRNEASGVNGAATRKRGKAKQESKTDLLHRQEAERQIANGDLTQRQVLALWEMIVASDGKAASERCVKLKPDERRKLVNAKLIAVENGPRPTQPSWMSTLHVTDAGWAWANRQGLSATMPPKTRATAFVFEALLAKVGKYLEVQDLVLADLLRPRRADPVEPPVLEERIREAYLRVTGGVMNESIKLARLRDALGPEAHEIVDEELRQMQQRGSTVLSPIDDPQLLRPEDETAALHIAGQRRDLVCIRS
jgi:hypothetical protein